MALFVGKCKYEYHIGEVFNPITDEDVIQADGHELEKCLKITGLPMSSRVMKFPFPWNQLIVHNWR